MAEPIDISQAGPGRPRTMHRYSLGEQAEKPDEHPSWLDKFWRPLGVTLNRLAIVPSLEGNQELLENIRTLAEQFAAKNAAPLLPRPRGRLPTPAEQKIYVAAAVAAAEQTLGLVPHNVQIEGALAVLSGRVAEMDTGEGKSLVAAMAAAAAALSGVPTHIVTVSDYLAVRDAENFAGFFECLGLTVAAIDGDMSPDERRNAYRADIVYAANKELTFDYLRDRASEGPVRNLLSRAMALYVAGKDERQRKFLAPEPVMRGLHFAIVDEADSVLVDEARVPLILSATAEGAEEVRPLYQAAREIALSLEVGTHYLLDLPNRTVSLRTDVSDPLAGAGRGTILEKGARRRRLLVVQALAAEHLFLRDRDYILRDEAVVLIDENTGRATPDRAWETDLQASVEVKEELPLTGGRETLAQISFQRFFRRYLNLAGLTGTASEVAGELDTIYGLKVQRIAPNRPNQREIFPPLICEDEAGKAIAVLDDVRRETEKGRPVLIGTRTVGASEYLADALRAAGLVVTVLNARQDEDEANIIAMAGQAGSITIATNMAGRGTDILLDDAARAAGGLHVVLTEYHEAGRIDRQLIGRSARQGDPGSARAIVALEDDLPRRYLPRLLKLLQRLGPSAERAWPLLFKVSQGRAQQLQGRARLALLEQDEGLEVVLAVSGKSL